MPDSTPSTSASEDTPNLGPLERTALALNTTIIQLGLYAQRARAEAEGELTPQLCDEFASIFAATSEPAEA
jgi:hypothetical protein